MAHRVKGLGSGIRFRGTRSGLFANAPDVLWGGLIIEESGSNPPPVTQSFSPLTITSSAGSGAVLWLRSDDVVLSSGFVSSWNDKSTKGLNFTASSTRAAGYNATSSFKGLPAVEFNGAAHGYTSNGPLPLTGTANVTIFAFVDAKGARNGGTFYNIFDSSPNTTTPYGAFTLGLNTAGTSTPKVGLVQTTQTGQTAPSEFATGSLDSELPTATNLSGVILIGKVDHNKGIGAKLQLTANYTPVTLKYGGTDAANLGAFGTLTASLGARFSTPSVFFSGAMMEIIVYDFELDLDQVTLVTNYLSGRYYP